MTAKRSRARAVAPPVTNRYGLTFVANPDRRAYASGARIATYYRVVCTRCGWRFAGDKHLRHRRDDCNSILRQFPELLAARFRRVRLDARTVGGRRWWK